MAWSQLFSRLEMIKLMIFILCSNALYPWQVRNQNQKHFFQAWVSDISILLNSNFRKTENFRGNSRGFTKAEKQTRGDSLIANLKCACFICNQRRLRVLVITVAARPAARWLHDTDNKWRLPFNTWEARGGFSQESMPRLFLACQITIDK